jgi:hypothetical protein
VIKSTKAMINEWQRIANMLSICIEYNVVLEIGKYRINFPVLVKDFGHTNGMLLVESYDSIKNIKNELNEKGYGYSVMPFDKRNLFDIETIKSVLCDWGWAGRKDEAPDWYKEPED